MSRRLYLPGCRPNGDGPLADVQFVVGHQGPLADIMDAPDAMTIRTGSFRRVRREGLGISRVGPADNLPPGSTAFAANSRARDAADRGARRPPAPPSGGTRAWHKAIPTPDTDAGPRAYSVLKARDDFPEPETAGKDEQRIRNVDVDILQIVLTGAANAHELKSRLGGRSEPFGRSRLLFCSSPLEPTRRSNDPA